MALRCPSCGSLNSDKMDACGRCGAMLAEAERVQFDAPKAEEAYAGEETFPRCPYCGGPMVDGTLDIVNRPAYFPIWVDASGEEQLEQRSVFDGHRCRACNCIVINL